MSAGVPKAVWYERGLSSETSKKCRSSAVRLCPVHLFFISRVSRSRFIHNASSSADAALAAEHGSSQSQHEDIHIRIDMLSPSTTFPLRAETRQNTWREMDSAATMGFRNSSSLRPGNGHA